MSKKALIIGAGPAGLTAAYELLTKSKDIEVTVFEETEEFGGISKTVNYKGNRMDMGGHRFFSKIPEVNAWWDNMLPMQGSKSFDDIVLERDSFIKEGGPDPEKDQPGEDGKPSAEQETVQRQVLRRIKSLQKTG